MAKRTPQQWAEHLRETVKDPDLRLHVARIVWWNYADKARTPEELMGWRSFQDEYCAYDEFADFTPDEIKEALILVGFSEKFAEQKVKGQRAKRTRGIEGFHHKTKGRTGV